MIVSSDGKSYGKAMLQVRRCCIRNDARQRSIKDDGSKYIPSRRNTGIILGGLMIMIAVHSPFEGT